ncbi:sodium:solute symporter family protein [Cerasicoccus frondis]|uniref:sodium:solute symporter family protein n=1 Tax=Cerasicoccus frondis TaxID=490090 RepID=UPI0028527187|nr:hypothetical protein [Cerasicoccus frondis]
MNKQMKSVADFMSGGRLAGRYLLTVAKGEMGAGAVVFVALFEKFGQAGFAISWWGWLNIPILLIVSISGFVVYRYRQTRAMTLAQFFEIRYSHRFRLFAGILGFVAGILNFGIIPGIGARFMVYILGLPTEISIFGLEMATYIPLMAVFLCGTLALTLSGGLITVMITDCIEGIFSQIFYIIIIVALLVMFNWDQIVEVLGNKPSGHSMFNPFDSMKVKDFNLWFVAMVLFTGIYGTMAWQNASGYNSASITPHESRMAGILGRWREQGKYALVTLLAICAITFIQNPDFAAQSAPATEAITQIDDARIAKQMELPISISYLLPIGIKGLFCAVLLMGIFGGDSTHLHSWGSIFVQDVWMPLRKKPFSPKGHIKALRLGIIGVAVFAFLFGIFFRQTEYILMWWSVTTAIFVGGAGSAIIGGLYWDRGTTAAAWASMLTGSILAGGGILLRQIYGSNFPLNGVQIGFYTALISIVIYVIVSFITCKTPFNMDRMLHRGEYAIEGESDAIHGKPPFIQRLIGIDGNFTTGDKWIAFSIFAWSMTLFFIVTIGSIWYLIAPWPESVWITYWHIQGVGVPIILAFITGIWFTWGGLRDMRRLFTRLKSEVVDIRDDGTVIDHHNADEQK